MFFAHMASYTPSAAAIAGALKPNRFDRTRLTSWTRLAATADGCVTAALTASKIAAVVLACVAAPTAWVAAASSHCAYWPATDVIAAAAAPCHGTPEVIAENDCAAELSSAPKPSQLAAAASIGPAPMPE